MKIIVTGFEPLGKEKMSPSWEAVKRLSDEINGAEIIKLQIPSIYFSSMEILIQKIEEIKPDAILSVGQIEGKKEITPEFIGINFISSDVPDNEGRNPHGNINDFGADGIFSTLPVEKMVERMRDDEIPARVSYTAGTFLSNYLLYRTLEHIKSNNLNIIGGLITVPSLEEQGLDKIPESPSMNLDMIVRGLELSLEEVAERLKIRIEKIRELEMTMLAEELERRFGYDV